MNQPPSGSCFHLAKRILLKERAIRTLSMKVLLVGATGYIGTAVAEKLKEAGHEVLALARSDDAEKRVASLGYTPARGDMADPARVAELARLADAIIHAATTGNADNPSIDATMTRAILEALEGSGKPFVYTSGVWSVGDTGPAVADESFVGSPLPLSAWRLPLEREVLAASRRGVRGIVMRPGIVYGRAGGIPSMLVAEARQKGGVRVIGDGRQEWPTVFVEDLADLYVRALSASPGALLHGTDGQHQVRDIAAAASLAGGADGRLLPWTVEDARKEYGGFGEFFALHQRVSSESAKWGLGWKPQGPSLLQDLLTGSYAKAR